MWRLPCAKLVSSLDRHRHQGVQHNLCTPKNGEIIIAATQDFLTAAYLLTCKDHFFDRARFALLCSYMGDALEQVDLPAPAILRPVELWTVREALAWCSPHLIQRLTQPRAVCNKQGKQLFGVLIRPNEQCSVSVSLEVAERAYTRGRHMCPSDGCVHFASPTIRRGRL